MWLCTCMFVRGQGEHPEEQQLPGLDSTVGQHKAQVGVTSRIIGAGQREKGGSGFPSA